MTSSTGTLLATTMTRPFGEPHSTPVPTDYAFTGKELDDTGLYYFAARYYDSSVGRFISQDTYLGNLRDPDTQHLYVYTANNPLKYVDPTGNSFKGVDNLDPDAGTVLGRPWSIKEWWNNLWGIKSPSTDGGGGGSGGGAGGAGPGKRDDELAADQSPPSKGTGSIIQGTPDSLPPNAKSAYDKYEAHGWKGNVPGQAPGTNAGGLWKNKFGELPRYDSLGNPITYREFDVNNRLPGAARDVERFIYGSDGSIYYTNDHYITFTTITNLD